LQRSFYLSILLKQIMKISKLIFLTIMAFSFASCGGDDNVAEGCIKCTLEVPLLDDCEVTLCDDASLDSSNNVASCVGSIFVGGTGTRAERVAELEDLGFSCN